MPRPTAPVIIPAVAGDGALFPIEKMKAHVDGQLHLAVSVFVFDGEHLLLQRRAAAKYHCGGLWANTCCTHPNWRETLEAAAGRRLTEELGFTLPLARHATVDYAADVGNGLSEHERVTLFSATADRHRLAIAPHPDEVSETRWITRDDLAAEISAFPERFTPWLRIYLARFPGLHLPPTRLAG
ncbi:isopentenyl-diphosphate delta-isomerase [Rhizobium sp. RU20A]|uniref:isopentenyl-diphosphate delta-isomerase n=1 Tax=Rhizobium sp. RU20A TaxID=1907412 RepID=UPI00122D4173|nr:isopentenyl-diphosphate delta-isomerase [Rhizobium sp. RU20A]